VEKCQQKYQEIMTLETEYSKTQNKDLLPKLEVMKREFSWVISFDYQMVIVLQIVIIIK
jgi:hypothetical protein